MQQRPIAGAERPHGRGRRQQHGIVQRGSRLAIARRRPQQRAALRDQVAVGPLLHHRAVGQFFQPHRQRVQFLAAGEPLPVQYRVDLARQLIIHTVAFLPRRAKAVRVLAPAVEARTVPGRECGRLIEKEQLGPAAAAHHLAPAPAEFADASEPGRGRPAFSEQRPGRGVVDDAAIAGEQPAVRGGDDLARRRDTVLQRHGLARLITPGVIASAAKQSILAT